MRKFEIKKKTNRGYENKLTIEILQVEHSICHLKKMNKGVYQVLLKRKGKYKRR